MILRRFMKHVTDQNWFAVGLDVIVVIVGIFLGLQVTEWNQERKDFIAARVYSDQLIVDTKFALEITEETIANYQDRLTITDELLKVLRGKPITEDNKADVNRALLFIMRMQPPAIEVGHIGDIINGTVPDIIRDEKLIRTMTELQRQLKVRIYIIEGPQDRLQTYLDIIHQYYAPQPYRFDHIPASYDIEVMRNSPEFILAVQNAMSMQTHGVEPSRGIKRDLEGFLKFLEENQ